MGKKRVVGDDRALMLLCIQARKYWRFYSSIYKQVKGIAKCEICADGKKKEVEVDHFPALGPRPRTIKEFADWWERLMFGPQRGLCHKHHKEVTTQQRKERKHGK